jgi:uncharacterized membrane-anchored protein YitT (DUF2179 family)
MSSIGRELRNAFLIILGILSAGMGLHGFLRSSNFIDGGVTGVSMLLEKTTGVKRSRILKVGDIILIFNIIVLFLTALKFLGVEAALYSILTYVAAARTLDFVIHGIDAFHAVTIISDQSVEIRARITNALGRGVTVYTGRGGKSGIEREILYCVVTRLEVGKVTGIIQELDPDAFVTIQSLAYVQGGIVKEIGGRG